MTRRIPLSGLAVLLFLAGPPPAISDPSQEQPSALERCRFYEAPGAVATCEQAVRENPGNLDARRYLAKSLIAKGFFDAAVDVYREIAAVRPDDADALSDLGGALGFVRRYAEAVAPMERVVRLRPHDVAAHQALAVIYTNLGRDADAVETTRKAAELGDSIAMFDLSRHYRDGIGVGRDPDRAVAWAAKAADAGHLGALKLMVDVYLRGLLGQAADDEKAKAWAWKFRAARRAGGGN